jgi:hypothetical protein
MNKRERREALIRKRYPGRIEARDEKERLLFGEKLSDPEFNARMRVLWEQMKEDGTATDEIREAVFKYHGWT